MRALVIILGLMLATDAALMATPPSQAGQWTMPPDDAARPDVKPRPEVAYEPRRRRPHRRRPGIRIYRVEPVPEVEPPAPIPPAPPQAVLPAVPPPPPDPHGPLRAAPARGVEPGPVRWRMGEALPPDLPHVTLDWRRYGLPEPPAGRIWVRVGRSVLLITATGRVVEAELPSG